MEHERRIRFYVAFAAADASFMRVMLRGGAPLLRQARLASGRTRGALALEHYVMGRPRLVAID